MSIHFQAVFSYLQLPDLRNCSLVCKNWYRFLNDENNDVWRMHCIRKLAEEALQSGLLSSVPTHKAKLRAFYHAWNPGDASNNVYIKENGFTLHRNPVAQSTDGARGKIGFRSGRHAWEVSRTVEHLYGGTYFSSYMVCFLFLSEILNSSVSLDNVSPKYIKHMFSSSSLTTFCPNTR